MPLSGPGSVLQGDPPAAAPGARSHPFYFGRRRIPAAGSGARGRRRAAARTPCRWGSGASCTRGPDAREGPHLASTCTCVPAQAPSQWQVGPSSPGGHLGVVASPRRPRAVLLALV